MHLLHNERGKRCAIASPHYYPHSIPSELAKQPEGEDQKIVGWLECANQLRDRHNKINGNLRPASLLLLSGWLVKRKRVQWTAADYMGCVAKSKRINPLAWFLSCFNCKPHPNEKETFTRETSQRGHSAKQQSPAPPPHHQSFLRKYYESLKDKLKRFWKGLPDQIGKTRAGLMRISNCDECAINIDFSKDLALINFFNISAFE
uniref:Uncharacterized protein n=1 Tax=Ditylenchus dipsaci TaxID=166011 RepID=A0A915ECR9_9BILA